MRRLVLFPRSLGWQLLAMLVLALLVTQGVSLLLFSDERSRAVRMALGTEAAGRAANVALLLEEAPVDLRPAILRSANSPLVRFSLDSEPAAPTSGRSAPGFVSQIRRIIGGAPERRILADLSVMHVPQIETMPNMSLQMRRMHDAVAARSVEPFKLVLSISMPDGLWLNVDTRFQRPDLQWSTAALAPIALMVLALGLVVWITARRIVGPMNTLARGADRLGQGADRPGPGISASALPVTGPDEVRRTTQAFNRMQLRLTRFIEERTHMLAALSHDLRSPLTAMRLRLELLDESEERDRLTAMVDEMQAMVEATLDFARGVASSAPFERVDLKELLSDLVGELPAGSPVTLTAPAGISAMIRPLALKRALRNLLENARRYGGNVAITLKQEKQTAVIAIYDDGPGLPDDQLARVFEPFVRVEASRSRNTGGVGLGLGIARAIIEAQGGEITLANRPEGGLCATVRIPTRQGS